MRKFNVVGQVFFADGFDYVIEADSEAAAKKIAKERAENAFLYEWEPAFQEAVIQSCSATNEETP